MITLLVNFKYIDTKILEEIYYNLILIDFIKGIKKQKLQKRQKRRENNGVIGPS